MHVALADVNGDGKPELLVGSDDYKYDILGGKKY